MLSVDVKLHTSKRRDSSREDGSAGLSPSTPPSDAGWAAFAAIPDDDGVVVAGHGHGHGAVEDASGVQRQVLEGKVNAGTPLKDRGDGLGGKEGSSPGRKGKESIHTSEPGAAGPLALVRLAAAGPSVALSAHG